MSKRTIAGIILAALIGATVGTILVISDAVHETLYPRDLEL